MEPCVLGAKREGQLRSIETPAGKGLGLMPSPPRWEVFWELRARQEGLEPLQATELWKPLSSCALGSFCPRAWKQLRDS